MLPRTRIGAMGGALYCMWWGWCPIRCPRILSPWYVPSPLLYLLVLQVEAIYESLGRPQPFQLRYALIDSSPPQPPTLHKRHTPPQQQQSQPQQWQPPARVQHGVLLLPPQTLVPVSAAPAEYEAAGESDRGAAPPAGPGATRGDARAASGAQQRVLPPKAAPAPEWTPAARGQQAELPLKRMPASERTAPGGVWPPGEPPSQPLGAPWQPQVAPRRWRTAMPPPLAQHAGAAAASPAAPQPAPDAPGQVRSDMGPSFTSNLRAKRIQSH